MYKEAVQKEGRATVCKDDEVSKGYKSSDNVFIGYKGNLAVNDEGYIIGATLSHGHSSDSIEAIGLIDSIINNAGEIDTIVGDRAYSTTPILTACANRNIQLVANLPKTLIVCPNQAMPEEPTIKKYLKLNRMSIQTAIAVFVTNLKKTHKLTNR